MTVDTIAKVRRAFFVQKRKIKAIARDLKLVRNTVREIVRAEQHTEHRYVRKEHPRPRLGAHVTALEQMLCDNAGSTKGVWTGAMGLGCAVRGRELGSLTQDLAATYALVSCGTALRHPSTFEPTVHWVGPPNHHQVGTCLRPKHLSVAVRLEPVVLLKIICLVHLNHGRSDIAAKKCDVGLHGSPPRN